MRIYRVNWQDPSDGHRLAWASSEREARQVLRKMIGEFADSRDAEPSSIQPVDIPGGKKELIHWLNIHFISDNG